MPVAPTDRTRGRIAARQIHLPVIVLLIVVLGGAGVTLREQPAQASSSEVAELTAGVNGTVYDTVQIGGRTFLGGSFSWAGPYTGSAVPVDPATGARSSIPRVNGPVHAAAADASGGWYVGGEFAFAGGKARSNAAQVTATGTVTAWDPSVNGPVRAVAARAGVVYLGGAFSTVGGQPRSNVAAVSVDTGAVLPWNPGSSGAVEALALSADGITVYAAGAFGIRAFDAATGDTRAWGSAVSGAMSALTVDGGTVYVGGDSTAAALDAATGSVAAWSAATDGQVRTIAVRAGVAYLGGVFTTVSGTARSRVAALDAGSGAVAAWNPGADAAVNGIDLSTDGSTVFLGGDFGAVGGQGRNRTAAVLAGDGSVTGWHPSAEAEVTSVAVAGAQVLVGGLFTMLNGLPRRNAAAVDASGEVDPLWNPSPDDVVYAVEASSDGATVFLGGLFSNLGPAARSRLAAVNLTTGEPLPRATWPTGANGPVRALKVSGGRLYVGGNFTRAGGVDTGRLAALDASNGAVDAGFTPLPDGTVRALTASPDGTKVYAVGGYTTIGGADRPGGAELWASTGAVTPFAPTEGGVAIAVALTPDGSRLFYSTSSNRTYAYDPATANTPVYTIRTGGDVQAIAASPTEVYIGGHFTTLPQVKLARLHAASFLVTDGTVTEWSPSPDGAYGVWSIEITSTALLLSGDFEKVGGKAQPGFARLPGTA